MKTRHPKYYILLTCILGSIIRFLYGYCYSPWNQASDQIAWEILLNEGSLSYDQLIHYPHEGGSILISIFSHFLKLFTTFHVLTIIAFLLDFGSRWIQLSIVQKVFDNKGITYTFGAWTVFGTPTIIPWATVNFGLHSISSFFPFILMYILWLDKDEKKSHIRNGLFLGFAFWFSYSNIVLIFVYFIYYFLKTPKSKTWFYSILSLTTILILHLITRLCADSGFHLEAINLTSIRGTNFTLNDIHTWKRIYKVWFTSLADSVIAVPHSSYLIKPIKYLWILIVFIGLIGFAKTYFKALYSKNIAINLLTILLFIIIYALSPFYTNPNNIGNYVSYRHLTYILPFLSLFTIIGLYSFNYKALLITIFLLIAIYGSSIIFTPKPSTLIAEKEAGWILSAKMGHNPKRLYHIISSSTYNNMLIMQGVGWGLSTVLFKEIEMDNPRNVNEKINMLINIINQFPPKHKNDLLEGVKFSFSEEVTPQLPKSTYIQFQKEMKKH